jgi:hypothetical protein
MRIILSFFFLLLTTISLQAQKSHTSVHGVVKDSLTDEGLAYVTVTFEGAGIGARTDINGNFFIESEKILRKVRFSYVGFSTKTVTIKTGQYNDITVLLSEASSGLKEVSIRPKKYSRKNNPAVDLIEEVFKHKDDNRKEGLDYYSFVKYEKLQMDINNVTDKFRNRWYMKPFRFIFSNVDTNIITHKVALPIYMRERELTAYYRKDPNGLKAILHGERQTGFVDEEQEEDNLGIDGEGVSQYLNSAFSDVDIYEPKIQLLGTEFVGPLSGIANAIYRFYIVDTVEKDGKKYADVFFAPRNKADLAFMGNLLVALDSTYAVMKVEMGVPKEINLNFVTDLHIEQEFDRIGDSKRLMLVRDAFTVDMNVLKKSDGRSILTHKTSFYKDYQINVPLPDSLFKGKELIENDTGKIKKRPQVWWAAHRLQPLTPTEQFVDKMVDSIKQVPIFKLLNGLGQLAGTGYQRFGFFDLGTVGSFYSFNDIEGFRARVGGRTNARLYKPLTLEGYVAYGFRDQQWKYNVGATYSFNGKIPRAFPQNLISVNYQRDLRIPGLSLERISQDNAALSLQRGTRDKMLLNSVFKTEYKREYKSQFSFSAVALQKKYNAAGTLSFEISDDNPADKIYANSLNTAELGLFMRYAPNQKFYLGPTYRYPIASKFPIFTMTFKNGFKGIAGGEYAFQKLTLSAEKRFFVAPFGYSDWTLTGGRTWGSVPYPLLELHPANQSYFYDWYAYNLMNFLEFVSDKYVALNVQHNLNGLIFNKIPLIKKLQWRENFSFKCLYGGLDAANDPSNTNGIFYFPTDAQGNAITHALGKTPYVEMSVGIGNLFRLIRVDYVWRLTYTDLPGVTKWGVRVMLAPKF